MGILATTIINNDNNYINRDLLDHQDIQELLDKLETKENVDSLGQLANRD